MTETAAAVLARMGTDAAKWTDEYLRITHEIEAAKNPQAADEWGRMVGWFANAIEAGRTAGRRETCPHSEWLTLSDDLIICRVCGYSDTFPEKVAT